MRRVVFVLATLAVAALAACGPDSKNVGDDDDSQTATGGDAGAEATGGSSGSALGGTSGNSAGGTPATGGQPVIPEGGTSSGGTTGELRPVLTMGTGTGMPMADIVTEVIPGTGAAEDDLYVSVSAIEPPEAGGPIEGPNLSSVDPGARVTFRVVPYTPFRWLGVRTYTLRVSSVAGGVLAEGKILWRRGQACLIS